MYCRPRSVPRIRIRPFASALTIAVMWEISHRKQSLSTCGQTSFPSRSCKPRQPILHSYPRYLILQPRMICRRHHTRIVKTAHRHVQLFRVRTGREYQWRPALHAKQSLPPGPRQFLRCPLRNSKILPPKRSPRHECRSAAPPAIGAVTMRHIIRLASRLISDRAAQTSTGNHVSNPIPTGMRLSRSSWP